MVRGNNMHRSEQPGRDLGDFPCASRVGPGECQLLPDFWNEQYVSPAPIIITEQDDPPEG